MAQPQDEEDDVGNYWTYDEAPPFPETPPPSQPILQAPRPPAHFLPSEHFVQQMYSLPFLPMAADLDRILLHNGLLPGLRQNIQPSELVQFLDRPRHVPSWPLQNNIVADESFFHTTPKDHEQPVGPENVDEEFVPIAIPPRSGSFIAQVAACRPDEHPANTQVQLPADISAASVPTPSSIATLPPYHTPAFPPGSSLPGFVPLGSKGQASVHQGNHWPIDPTLRGEIVHAELDNYKRRPEQERLTYREILEKYTEWNPVPGVKKGVVRSTLRGFNRRYTIPDKENRVRVPKWHAKHLRALREAVPRSIARKGKISWKAVRDSVEADTGRPFGLAALSAKWSELQGNDQGEGDVDSAVQDRDDDEDAGV